MSGRRSKSRRSGHPAARAAARGTQAPTKARTAKRPRPAGAQPAAAARRVRTRAGWGAGARLSRGASTLLERMLSWNPELLWRPRSTAALGSLDRVDAYWALATWALSVVLFATVISSHPGLSDATEGAAGVSSLGILHAPGYPSYVLVGRLFTLIEPFGNMAVRVGLFSLLCASLSVVGVQLLARRCGAARWAASLGALCLAAGAGYWFYAGFTKHDQFSGLTVCAALYLLLAWDAHPTAWRLTGLAVALGLGLGSSWPLTIMLGPAVLYVLVRSWRRIPVRSLALATAAGAAIAVGSYGFVIVRAGENPALNWGQPTTVGRVVNLILRSDFTNPTGTNSNSVQAPRTTHAAAPTRPPAAAPTAAAGGILATAAAGTKKLVGLANYVKMFWRELGILGFLLAAWGAIATLAWRRGRWSVPLLLVFATNLLGALATVAPGESTYTTDLIEEGFLLGCYFALACWVAIGATDVGTRLLALTGRARLGRLLAPVRAVPLREDRDGDGSVAHGDGSVAHGGRRAVVATTAAALAAATVIPLVTAGWAAAHRSDHPYADAYAQTVFSELPKHSAVFVWGSDLNLPLTYRQVVYHERPDVLVVAVGALRFGWYRDEISRSLGRALPAADAETLPGIAQEIRAVAAWRPTYIDEQAAESLTGQIGYRTVGLVSRIVPGANPPHEPAAALERTALAVERAAGMPSRDWAMWPNAYLEQADYVSLALRAARYAYDEHNLPLMRQALLNVVHIDPTNSTAQRDLALMAGQSSSGATAPFGAGG